MFFIGPLHAETKTPIAIVIHGGAGNIVESNLPKNKQKAYHQKLTQALQAGYKILETGGSSIEAVQAAIVVMEDSPLFNAGKGAVFTHHKTNELDASIMEGKTLNAGAVTGVTVVKNPIKLAASVMFHSPHVLLSGQGAEAFAKSQKLEIVKPDYFYTQRRWQQLLKVQQLQPQKTQLSEDAKVSSLSESQRQLMWQQDYKFGTVGAVALDKDGNLAAGTSTGGMTNKRYGRIGDSPLIGAGTYADNQSCAISATGHGEYFIRAAVAHDICARSSYLRIPLAEAADQVIQQKLVKMGASGGVIGLSPNADPLFSFNSSGMFRGYIDKNGKVYTALFGK